METIDSRTEFLETEVGLLKDTVWRLTGRVFVLENFIKKEFGEVLGASRLYSNPSTENQKPDSDLNNREYKKRSAFPKRYNLSNHPKRRKVEDLNFTAPTGSSINGSSPRSLRNRPNSTVNYQDPSSDEYDGEDGALDSDWPGSDIDYDSIVPKNEVIEDNIDQDKNDINEDHFVGNLLMQQKSEEDNKTAEKPKTSPTALNLGDISPLFADRIIPPRKKKIRPKCVSTPELDEEFQKQIPLYFSKFLGKFKCHDLFPSDRKYEQLKTLVKLPKGHQLDGVGKSKKLRVQQRFMLKQIDGEDVLLCRLSGKRILKQTQFLDVMKLFHDEQGHQGRDNTHKKLQEIYACIPRDLVSRFIKECEICISRRAKQKGSDGSGGIGTEVNDGGVK